MSDHDVPKQHDKTALSGLSELSSRALVKVAGRSRRAEDLPDHLDLNAFAALQDAVKALDRMAFMSVAADMVAAGISKRAIAEDYIPALSRLMGAKWCEDQLSFTEVTVRVSLLQAVLRDLGPEWRATGLAKPGAKRILVAVPHEEFHTLGAVILAGQLRRLGFVVNLHLDSRPFDVARSLSGAPVEAVFLSAAPGSCVQTLRSIAAAVRKAKGPDFPIVLGGSILEFEPEGASAIGASLETNNLTKALEHCGLINSALDRLSTSHSR